MTTEGEGAIEQRKDAGEGKKGDVVRWRMELDIADKQEKAWRDSALKTIERYRDEKDREDAQFNILYSNVQTLAPSLYAKTPLPDVRRRYRDKDELGKQIAEVLERAGSFTLDDQDFDCVMNAAVMDMLLPGRAVTRVRYVPSFSSAPAPAADSSEGEASAPSEDLAFEECVFEHVDWQDFRRGPGRRWDEVPWIAFRHRLTRDQLIELNGEVGKEVHLDYTPEDTEERDNPDVFKRGTVWEIWDKEDGKVKWVSKTYTEDFLAVEDPDIQLKGFFPIPRPLYAVEDTGSLVPVDEYRIYKDQAEELDRLTLRITRIIEVLKVRGVADSQIAELWSMEDAEDGDFVPAENIMALADKGGLAAAIWMFPVESIVQVLRELYLQRDQIKQTIYEIMGISDILRGSTKSSETATAQSIKAQWGSQRLEKRQKEVQRYARDLIRIAIEIIAEKFQPMTIQLMTGKPVTEEMKQVMSVDGLRSFRVDIETDSTISADEESDKQNITALIQSITGYISTVGPAVAEGYFPADAAKAILLAGVRRFKLGRDVEDAVDQIGGGEEGQPQQPQGPSEAELRANADQQAAQAQMQLDMQKMQADTQLKQAELDAKAKEAMAKLQADIEQYRADIQVKMSQFQAQLEQNQAQHEDKMELEWAKLGAAREKDVAAHHLASEANEQRASGQVQNAGGE